MKKTIYISGPITDNKTGQPRKGWQKDFLDAEEKLREMGFEVVTPIEIAYEAESTWNELVNEFNLLAEVPRWFYLEVCLERMVTLVESNIITPGEFAGIYLIGTPEDIQQSFVTMCEINFAISAGLPVWSQYYHGYAVDNLLRQKTNVPTIAEVSKVQRT